MRQKYRLPHIIKFISILEKDGGGEKGRDRITDRGKLEREREAQREIEEGLGMHVIKSESENENESE